MDKLFVNLGCPEEYRVPIAAFYLKEDDDLWWQTRKVEIETPLLGIANGEEEEEYYKGWL